MFLSLAFIMFYAQLGFMALGVIFYFITPKQKRRGVFEIGVILFLGLLVDLLSLSSYYLKLPYQNLWPNIYGIISVVFLIEFYRKRFDWPFKNAVAYSVSSVFIVFGVVDLLWFQKVESVNTLTNAIGSAILVMASTTYLISTKQLRRKNEHSTAPMFWINSAILLMYLELTIYFATFNYLYTVVKSDMFLPTIILHCVQLVFYWMLWIALWLNRNQKSAA